MLQTVIFVALGLISVVAGIIVFRTDSMARATYALAVSFVAVGAMLLQLNLGYIGVVTILMMVMEMAIMAIFMIMLMGMNPALMPMSMVHNKIGSLLISIGTFVFLAVGALLVPWPERRGAPALDLTASLGEAIMGHKMLVMLTVSPVLFATLISALVLANPRGRYRSPGTGGTTPDTMQEGSPDRPAPDATDGGGPSDHGPLHHGPAGDRR